eukprot:jgi/Bigna1/80194/fgenesh1_pg.68_\
MIRTTPRKRWPWRRCSERFILTILLPLALWTWISISKTDAERSLIPPPQLKSTGPTGIDEIDYLQRAYDMGQVSMDRSEWVEAEKHFEVAYQDLAMAIRFTKAREGLQKCLEIRNRTLSPVHDHYVLTLLSLADLERDMGLANSSYARTADLVARYKSARAPSQSEQLHLDILRSTAYSGLNKTEEAADVLQRVMNKLSLNGSDIFNENGNKSNIHDVARSSAGCGSLGSSHEETVPPPLLQRMRKSSEAINANCYSDDQCDGEGGESGIWGGGGPARMRERSKAVRYNASAPSKEQPGFNSDRKHSPMLPQQLVCDASDANENLIRTKIFCKMAIGMNMKRAGNNEKALQIFEEGYDEAVGKLGDNTLSHLGFNSQANLGICLVRQGTPTKVKEGLPLLLTARDGLRGLGFEENHQWITKINAAIDNSRAAESSLDAR